MGLLKTKTITERGFEFTGEYWKIGMISMDFDRGEGSFSINLYKDKATADADTTGQFISSVSVNMMGEENSSIFKSDFVNSETINVRKICYEYLKANDEFFSDATDD